MPTFVLLTRLSPKALRTPRALETFEREAIRRIHAECPAVEWVNDCAVFGPYDYLDIFRAPDVDTAAKVAGLMRIHSRARTEIWPAIEVGSLEELGRDLEQEHQELALKA